MTLGVLQNFLKRKEHLLNRAMRLDKVKQIPLILQTLEEANTIHKLIQEIHDTSKWEQSTTDAGS